MCMGTVVPVFSLVVVEMLAPILLLVQPILLLLLLPLLRESLGADEIDPLSVVVEDETEGGVKVNPSISSSEPASGGLIVGPQTVKW